MAAASDLTAWFASRWNRLNGPHRVSGIDLARGLAIVGMFAAHMFDLPAVDWTDAGTWGGVADGRSSILFATLAGVSLALVTGGRDRLEPVELNAARGRILVRAGVIWVAGALLILTRVPVLVILPAYAILFVVALPFLRLRPAALLTWASALALVMPFVQVFLEAQPIWSTTTGQALAQVTGWYYPFPVWLAFVLCGMGIGRLDLRSLGVQAALVWGGALLAASAYGLDAVGGSTESAQSSSVWAQVWTARPHSTGLLEVIGSGGFAVAAIGACLLVCRTWLRWVVLPLRTTGSMPLSAYTAQLLAWAVVAWIALADVRDLAGFRALEPFVPFTITTIICCTVWALCVGRGPLEWLVDRATQPVRVLTDAPR